MKRKLMALVMAVAMVCLLLPVTAMADQMYDLTVTQNGDYCGGGTFTEGQNAEWPVPHRAAYTMTATLNGNPKVISITALQDFNSDKITFQMPATNTTLALTYTPNNETSYRLTGNYAPELNLYCSGETVICYCPDRSACDISVSATGVQASNIHTSLDNNSGLWTITFPMPNQNSVLNIAFTPKAGSYSLAYTGYADGQDTSYHMGGEQFAEYFYHGAAYTTQVRLNNGEILPIAETITDPSGSLSDKYIITMPNANSTLNVEKIVNPAVDSYMLTRVWIEGERLSQNEDGYYVPGEQVSMPCGKGQAYSMAVRLNGKTLFPSEEDMGCAIFTFQMPSQASTMEIEYTRRIDIHTFLLSIDGEEFGYYVEGEEDGIDFERKPGYNTVVKLNGGTPIAPTESHTYDGKTYDDFRFTMPATDSNLTCEYVAQSGGSSYSGTTYTVLESKNLNWNGQSAGITARIANDIANYTGTTVDGITLTKNQVSVTSGSTIVNLKPAFLKTLSAGTHTMRVNFLDGYTDVSFTVKGTNTTNPETGANDFVGIAVALCAAAAISAAIISKKH